MENTTAQLKLLRFIRQFIHDFDLNDLDELLGIVKEAIQQPIEAKTTTQNTTLH